MKTSLDSRTQIYGILGYPVSHSSSPLIHNALFERFGLNAAYLAFPVPPDSLGMAFEGIRALGIRGVNLTVPHKEKAFHFVDEIPEDIDRRVGALNTVVNKDGVLYGYNTDGAGFLTAVSEELGFNPQGKKVLLLGAGGAARAVAFALGRAHAGKLLIHNRTPARAEGLAQYLEPYFQETEIKPLGSFDALRGEKIDLVVNATSCGLRKEDPPPFDLRLLGGRGSVYDLIYSPARTAFLKSAGELGLPCANGLGMLAAQAALSFELWTGRRSGVREAMLETLKTCR